MLLALCFRSGTLHSLCHAVGVYAWWHERMAGVVVQLQQQYSH